MRTRAFIWLQEDEPKGWADCGCRVKNSDGRGVQVHLCAMHDAVPRMLDALREIAETASLVAAGKVEPQARIERITWVAQWGVRLAQRKRGGR